MLLRGVYFRVCADATLRGPDNSIVASYAEGLWRVGRKRCLAFESGGPISLRVTDANGRQANIGPYEFIRATEGAIFTQNVCLGRHDAGGRPIPSADLWREIVILTAA